MQLKNMAQYDFRMKLQLAYESSFKNHFGRNITKHLNGMLVHAKMFFSDPSLGTRIQVIAGNPIDAGDIPEATLKDGGIDVGLM